jgi:hypothetical protein
MKFSEKSVGNFPTHVVYTRDFSQLLEVHDIAHIVVGFQYSCQNLDYVIV